jgi:hypothetical protein
MLHLKLAAVYLEQILARPVEHFGKDLHRSRFPGAGGAKE